MIAVHPCYADSLGAKSFCTQVATPDLAVLIDPGAAILQKTFPAPETVKEQRLHEARDAIRAAAAASTHVIITHYHHDHYLFDPALYHGRHLWIKSPNTYVNRSQWYRSREFLRWYADTVGGSCTATPPEERTYADPVDNLPLSAAVDSGAYASRREALLRKWRQRYEQHVRRWQNEAGVAAPAPAVEYCDGRTMQVGTTTIRFSNPLFHGIEYASTGFVIAVVIEHGADKFLYTSDLMGPLVEDYAAWIISESPDVILIDGPPTYLLGYLLNRTNLDRCIANIRQIAGECPSSAILLDHHVTRDTLFRERMGGVYDLSPVATVAEHLGKETFADRCREGRRRDDTRTNRRYD